MSSSVLRLVLLSVPLALLGWFQLGAQPPDDLQVLRSQDRFRKEYLLGPSDQIEIFVRRVPEASRTVTIRPDGYISLPLVDNIQAAGLSAGELKTRLTERLSTRLKDPEVNVIAVQTRQPTVYVFGEVGAPNAIPLRNATTVMQAIAYTGGFRRSAAVRKIWIIRLGEDGYVNAIPVPVHLPGQVGPYAGLSLKPLQADDIIFVPENKRSRVTRWLDEFLSRPLQGFNSALQTYLNYKLIQLFSQ